jgi:ubiquinone/menaquinone biosynthesis C-methylase UbiE
MGFEETSYKIHEKTFSNSDLEKDLAIYKNWFDRPTTDLWRHKRMLSVLLPFLSSDVGAKWITIGDGRFGTSASFIQQHKGEALATDIDISLLKVAKDQSMLNDFAYANAENLPFKDQEFDYAYCKQAYHHFPRPLLAVYEMLRVSKTAVVFTEPHDFTPLPPLGALIQKFKNKIKSLFGKQNVHHDTGNYESIGNYVYGISVREFEKIALGLNLPCIAYKRFDDVYIEGVESELHHKNAKLYKKIKFILKVKNLRFLLGINYPNTIQMIIFKTKPKADLVEALEKNGYSIVLFSPNPYL